MVCCNHNGGVAVFLRKIDRCLESRIEVQRLLYERRQIIRMAGMIDASAFNHHYETFFIC
ncbi:hypothetical protein D3C81_1386090 [compost metagenome]